MMRMAVRPQKSQFPGGSQPIIFPANNSFIRDKYCMFGYTRFSALLIGGAGGRSGIAEGRNIGGRTFVHSSGGGGGGALIFEGALAALPSSSTVTVGAGGGDGVDTGNDVSAGDGVNGGNTVFAGVTANGGQGGQGGKVDVTTGGVATVTRGEGGSGGGNSAAAGSIGIGGLSANYDGTAGAQVGSNGTAPTDGVMELVGLTGIVAGGGGGGGGRAEERLFGDTKQGSSSGATGNSSGLGGAYAAPGGDAGTSKGGHGGGCNAQVYTGLDQAYGDNSVGGIPHGLVAIKLS